MTNGLALSPFTDFSKRGVREKAVCPAKLVVIDIESNGGGDWLTREARGGRWEVVWESDDPKDKKWEYGLKPCNEKGG